MSREDPRALLDALAEELAARGLGEQVDFYVVGRFPDRVPSSEHIGIRHGQGRYSVWYRDMGRSTPLVETEDFEEARAVFVTRAVELGRSRGRHLIEEDR